MRIPEFSRQELALVGVTILWGGTFLVIRNALDVTGPLFFVGLRLAAAACALGLISLPVMRGITSCELFAGTVIGACLFAGFALQTAGMQTISASKSAFITAFYVPAVPVLQWIIWRRPPRVSVWVGVVLAFAGIVLMAGPDGVSSGYGRGEALSFLSALAFAAEILLIGLFAGRVHVCRIVIVQVGVASILSFACMPLAGEEIPAFSQTLVYSACGLGIMTALIQSLMNWAQRSVSPARATVIYAGEPVWAGVFGRIAGEVLSVAALCGGALILTGILVSGLGKARKDPRRRKDS